MRRFRQRRCPVAERAASGQVRSDTSPTGPGLLAAGATFVAIWPYTAAIRPGLWLFVVCAVTVVVGLTGILTRFALHAARAGIRGPVVLGAQAAAAITACTAMLAGETGLFGLIPTTSTFRLIGIRLGQSAQEISEGAAPIAGTLPMATLLGLAFAVVAILVDQLITHRQVVLAIVLTSVVGVMPMLISFSAVNIGWFLVQAIVILMLLRYGARHDRRSPRQVSYLAAGATGVLAIALTLVLGPMLPVASALPGMGPVLTVNADLRLGDDLRRPGAIEALTLVTSAPTAPYLRMATLSRFDGDVWRPDRGDRVPLREGFGERDWDEPIATAESEVSIRVLGFSSDRLPMPYAPERVTGVNGIWSAVPENRTVLSRSADAAGADYTVMAATAVPTLEQIRDSAAAGADTPDLPEDLPGIIRDLAQEVTAQARTDYDRLIALQNWFRSEFAYSLDAPVEEGFDGTGVDAVATFLEERTGYCIHFAGAFALMAKSLDMPVRIVVGYLPGTPTDLRRDDDIVYSVSSDQLHSWPEVHFEGIGWVPFEPTATLGVPTEFAAAAGGDSGDGPDAPVPTAAPTTGPSTAPTSTAGADRDAGGGGGGALRTFDPTPVLVTVLGAAALLLLPGLLRELRRAVRMSRARSGDAVAAWRELSDTLIDVGLPASTAETARARAEALAAKRGVDAEALAPLVRAVEFASYARKAPDAGDLAAPLRVVVNHLMAGLDAPRRIMTQLLPASLFTRNR